MKRGVYVGLIRGKIKEIKEGSTKQEVIDYLGTPDTIQNYSYFGDIWRYGKINVSFDANYIVRKYYVSE